MYSPAAAPPIHCPTRRDPSRSNRLHATLHTATDLIPGALPHALRTRPRAAGSAAARHGRPRVQANSQVDGLGNPEGCDVDICIKCVTERATGARPRVCGDRRGSLTFAAPTQRTPAKFSKSLPSARRAFGGTDEQLSPRPPSVPSVHTHTPTKARFGDPHRPTRSTDYNVQGALHTHIGPHRSTHPCTP